MTESSFSFRQNWIWTSGPSNVRRGLYNLATQLFIFVLKMLQLYSKLAVNLFQIWSSELRSNASSDGDIVRKRYVIRKTDLCYKISSSAEGLSWLQHALLNTWAISRNTDFFTNGIRHFPTPTSNHKMWFLKTFVHCDS